MSDAAIYIGLFLSALASATLIPGQSEAMLVALLLGGYSPLLILVVAGVGNILGSVINWFIGCGIERIRDRRWFPVKPENLERARVWYAKYGKWSLLLSWMPVIGDPLTVVAGVMREPFGQFLALVSIAKVGRYLVLAVITLRFMG